MIIISAQGTNGVFSNNVNSESMISNNLNNPQLLSNDYNGSLTFLIKKTVQMTIKNSYENKTHVGTFVADQYSGWTLSKVVFSIGNLNATYEFWTSNQSGPVYEGFKIQKTTDGDVYNGLKNNITPWLYDWNLVNVSIKQRYSSYDPDTVGTCYYAMLNSSGDFSDNITTYHPMLKKYNTWATYNFTGLTIKKSTDYFFVYNGTKLHPDLDDTYPQILWYATNLLPAHTNQKAQKYYANASSWESIIYEPMLNISFIYWNRTSDSPIIFKAPENVSMKINGMSASQNTVFNNPASNYFEFVSNSSVSFNMNASLYYTKSMSETHNWYINGSQVTWNMTFTSTIVSGAITSYLIMEYPTTWTVTGLYNTTSNENYTNYELLTSPNRINITDVSNTTWVMVATAPDYVSQIRTFDGAELTDSISIEKILTIDVYVNDSISGISVGTVWLSITKDSVLYYNATATPDITGVAEFNWDIDQNASLYGYYEIHANWTDGDRAGYQDSQIFIYHPTSLTTDNNQTIYYPDHKWIIINATFTDTYTSSPINDSEGSVLYSIDLGTQHSMSYSSGLWTANITLSFGTHLITIYGTGFGYENRSKSFYIQYHLRTQISHILVSSLPYSDTTILKVNYTMYNGTAVSNTNGGQVQANITGSWINLLYNSSSKLWVATVYGWHYDLGIVHIGINGTGSIYETSTTVATLTIIEANSTRTYSPSNVSLYYTEHTVFEYRYMAPNGTIIKDATINITLSGHVYPLRFNVTSGNYTIQLNGTSIIDTTFTVSAWRHGFKAQTDSIEFHVNRIPTNMTSIYPAEYYGSTPFDVQLNITNQLNSTPVNGFTITAYVNGSTTGSFVDYNNGSYTITIVIHGFGNYNLTILASRYGFVSQTSTQFISVMPLNASMSVIIENTGIIMSGDAIYLSINVTNTYNGSYVSGFMFEIWDYSSIYPCNVTDYNNGTYLVSFTFRTSKNMTVNLNITGYEGGFNNITESISFDMYLYNGISEIVSYTPTVDYGDLINISVRWLFNNTGLENGTCIVNATFSIVSANGYYNISINSTQFSPAHSYDIKIILTHIDFENESHVVTIHIKAINTILNVDTNLSVMMNHTLIIRATFYSVWNNSPIFGTFSLNWSNYEINVLPNRTYLISLNTDLVRPASYVVRISASSPSYVSSTVYSSITIMPRIFSISGSFYITYYENETISLQYTVVDSETHTAVRGLQALVNINATTISYNISGTIARIGILFNKSGIYNGNIQFSAYGYANTTNMIVFTIKPKVSTAISISGPDSIVIGGYLVVDATLRRTNDSMPIALSVIEFVFKIYTVDNGIITVSRQSETNSNGFAQGAISINESFARIEVYVQYSGNLYYWSSKSSTLSINVNAPESIVDRIVQFISTPIGQMSLLLLVIGVVVGSLYSKLIKPKKIRKRNVLEDQLLYFTNLSKQRHVLIILDTGIPIFSYGFSSGLKTDETLIAGLLTAINSVASEIRDDAPIRLKSIDYEGMKVFVLNKEIEGHTVSFVLIGDAPPIDTLSKNFEEFANAFAEQYGEAIRDFVGDLDTIPPEEVRKLLDKYLNTILLTELYVRRDITIEGKYKKFARELPSSFTIKQIIEKSKNPAETLNILIEMIKLGYIEPV